MSNSNRFFFCPTSTTLAEELDKILQKSRGGSPSKNFEDDGKQVRVGPKIDKGAFLNRRESSTAATKLNGGAAAINSGINSRNHVIAQITNNDVAPISSTI